jgi:restriction system protein
MPRRQQSILEETSDLLKLTPSWLGPLLAVTAFIFFRFVIPLLVPDNEAAVAVSSFTRQIMAMLAWVAAGAVLLLWVMAEVWKLFNRRLLDGQADLASIKNISWQEFEHLVSEAYRRKGYLAEVVGNAGGDGGVDIQLTGPGETVLVQCKQWRAFKVGVTIVREMLGVVVSQRASRGIIVTSGRFTQEARDFAKATPTIQLVDGPALFELIRVVQKSPAIQKAHEGASSARSVVSAAQSPRCPSCGAEMVLRTARKGTNAGSQFWGCPKYPGCRGTRQIMGVPA